MKLVESICGPENTVYLLMDAPELFVEVVNQRLSRRDFHTGNVRVANAVQLFHDAAKAISMAGDEGGMTCHQQWLDALEPVGHDSFNRVLQAFAAWKLIGWDIRIFWVVPGVSLVG